MFVKKSAVLSSQWFPLWAYFSEKRIYAGVCRAIFCANVMMSVVLVCEYVVLHYPLGLLTLSIVNSLYIYCKGYQCRIK